MNLGLPNVTEFALAFGFIAIGVVLAMLAYFWNKHDKNAFGPAILAFAALIAMVLAVVIK